MRREGWNAKGLLDPLWGTVGGRDGLAKITGIPGTSLSSINSGKRNLGIEAGQKIAAALGVSLAELGAPEEAAVDAGSKTLRHRLDELATKLGDALDQQQKNRRELLRLRRRVEELEALREVDSGAARGPR